MPKSFHSKSIPPDSSPLTHEPPSDVENVESLYRTLESVERPARESRFSRPLVATLLGFVAGGVGALMIVGDVFGIATRLLGQDAIRSVSSGRTVVYERKERIDVPWEDVNVRIYEDIGKQVHPLFKKKKVLSEKDSLGAVYTHDESVGSAVGLTSDGWLVTVRNALKDHKASYVVAFGGVVYDVETIVADPASDLVFFRIRADGIAPVRFFSKPLSPGLLAIVASLRQGEVVGSLAGLSSVNMRITNAKDLYESSERLSSFFHIDARSSVVPGSAAFSLNGELMGVYDGAGGYIPSSRVEAVLPSVLKQERVPLTVLGITALDLSTASFDSKAVRLPSFGFRIQTIQTNSPAQRAKLQAGDVITAIESERVGRSASLFERIQEYPPDTTVILEIMRGSDTLKVPVTLGGAK